MRLPVGTIKLKHVITLSFDFYCISPQHSRFGDCCLAVSTPFHQNLLIHGAWAQYGSVS